MIKRIKTFIRKFKNAWVISKEIQIIKNGATGENEVWCKTNEEYYASLYRLR